MTAGASEGLAAASRDSLDAVQRRFDVRAAGLDDAGVATLASELAAVAELLTGEVVLRKHLADRTDDPAPKLALVDRLFGGKIAAPTLDVLRAAVEQRWSSSRDLVEALAGLARGGVLVGAERAGRIDDVEDELFRFGRTLDANPRLARLLSDRTAPAAGRIGLLDDVLGGRANSFTTALLQQEVRLVRGDLTDAVPKLAEFAAARRGESVAHVVAAAPLTDDQLRRLENVLSRIYRRTISVQLEIDPEILGGLRITVGDEVVDGTVLSRLNDASAQLPH